MKNNIYNYIIAFILSLSFSGCDDFLKEQSQDEVIPKTARDLSELLWGSGYLGGNDNFYPYLFAMSDNVSANTEILSLAEQTSYKNIEASYTWQADMAARKEYVPTGLAESSNTYTYFYLKIKGCNAVIDLIDDASGDIELKEKTKAQAYALRALHYFNLVNLYGVPYNKDKNALAVPLKTTVDVENGGIARATVEQVYKLIVSDLELAISIFEKYSINRADYRINLPATCILLSRVYLFMEDWTNCEKMATKAIENSQGLSDLSLENSAKPTLNYNYSEVEWLFGNAEYSSILNYNGYFIPSDDLLSLFDKDNDGRYISSFSETSTRIREDEDNPYASTTYYFTLVKKHESGANLGSAIRLGEAYINRAEAYFNLTENLKATGDYNYLRNHRIKNNVDVASVTLKDILNERRRELCFELPRWFDLRRNGMPSITHKHKLARGKEVYEYTLKEDDSMYTLPIPEGVFSNNSLLIQNDSRKGAAREGVLLND
ncbi:MAG: RagB/SusD family nutrient uptake outer membrane protein [Marinifilaceae bacterium]|jgi:hypothetical protein|nr:RagB/SusD family nutrient uptake outer membrane protein [Marinifilaceae bacterium]